MANFFKSVTGFIDKYLIVGLAAVIVVLAIALGVSQFRLSRADSALTDARTEINRLGDKVKAKEIELALKEAVVSALEGRNTERLAEQQTYQFDLQGVLNAPEEENRNAVDDVLCRAVSGSKCLRNN